MFKAIFYQDGNAGLSDSGSLMYKWHVIWDVDVVPISFRLVKTDDFWCVSVQVGAQLQVMLSKSIYVPMNYTDSANNGGFT